MTMKTGTDFNLKDIIGKDNKINILNLQGTYTDFTNKYISKEELINYFNDNFNFKFLTISNDVNSIDNIYDENESYVIDSIKKEKNVRRIIIHKNPYSKSTVSIIGRKNINIIAISIEFIYTITIV